MSCPSPCSCYHDATWSSNIVECSATNVSALPPKLPMDATELWLDVNNMPRLKSHTFIGRKNLQALFLNDSNIEVLDNFTFNGLPNMLELHLHDNIITKLEGDEFQGMPLLRVLNLADNLISSIANVTFASLGNLEVLYLQGNRLRQFSVWSLSAVNNPALTAVLLAGNLWSCGCAYLEEFSGWLDVAAVVQDRQLITCTTSSGETVSDLAYCEEETLSSHDTGLSLSSGHLADTVLAPAIAAAVTLFILILAIIVLALYRSQIKIWMFSRYGVRFFERVSSSAGRSEDSKMYDAFVMYSSEDELYVQQVFAGELEAGPYQYRLCLYHRDVGPSHFVPDSIIQANETSKRAIFILSENFIKQEWTRYDIQQGFLQSLSALSSKLILIMLDTIKFSDLDAKLRAAISNAVIIHWGEDKFWEKVKYNLPECPEQGLSQSTTLQSYPSTLHSYPPSISSPGYYQTVDLYGANPRYHIITNNIGGNNGLEPPISSTNGVLLSPIPAVSAPLLQDSLNNGSFNGVSAHQLQHFLAAGSAVNGGIGGTLQPNGGVITTSTPTVMFQSRTLRSSGHRQHRLTANGGGRSSNGDATPPVRHQNVYTMSNGGNGGLVTSNGNNGTNPRSIEHIYQVCM